jgi:fructokinase
VHRRGRARDRDLREHRLPTTDPATTLTGLSEALAEWQAEMPFTALGIGTFGPARVSPDAPDYGQILPTPKPGWTGARVLDHFADRFAVPIAFDTDVGAAALAEGRWGRARGCSTHAYVTVGTGIGIGIVANGQVLHGALHPEAGHLRAPPPRRCFRRGLPVPRRLPGRAGLRPRHRCAHRWRCHEYRR